MKRTYAVYRPAEAGLPFLAVILENHKPVEMFGCEDKESADRVLVTLQARYEPSVGEWPRTFSSAPPP